MAAGAHRVDGIYMGAYIGENSMHLPAVGAPHTYDRGKHTKLCWHIPEYLQSILRPTFNNVSCFPELHLTDLLDVPLCFATLREMHGSIFRSAGTCHPCMLTKWLLVL